MDIPTLHSILVHTYSQDNSLRNAAEASLAALPSVPGAVMMLLSITTNPQVHREIRQAATIALKNCTHKHWRLEGEDLEKSIGIPDNDKPHFRQALLEALFQEVDSSIRSLLAECLNTVARADFPVNWPTLIDEIVKYIKCGEPLKMFNALIALRKVVKIYEYKSSENGGRDPLNRIVQMVFPTLRQLFENLLSNNSIESAQMLHFICKVYWSSIQLAVPPFAAQISELGAWMELLNRLLAKPLPEASENLEPFNQPVDEAERTQWPWWKAKKWIVQTLCRLYTRWANPRNVEEENIEMSNFFRTQVAPSVLASIMDTLALRKNGRFCTDRVVQLCLVFMQNAIEPSITYKLIKPHLDFLLFEVIHPILCMTPNDMALWNDDPHEFVRKSHDVFEDFLDPVTAAGRLLADLSRKRGKDCFPKILGFYNQILTVYQNTPPENRDYIQKDAALHAISELDATLTSSTLHRPMVEPMLVQHVIPEFNNPNGFLRYRVCKMFSKNFIKKVNFQDPQILVHIAQGVLKCMHDSELPVRVEAAKTLRVLVVYEQSSTIADVVRPLLPQILEQYFKLMDEIGNDEVISALETLIGQFDKDIAPYAVQLVEKLVEAFDGFASQAQEDDEAAMAAVQCLDAINTILITIQDHREIYPLIEPLLIPFLRSTLSSDDGIEYLDGALTTLTSITYSSNKISPQLWSLFPLLFVGFENWAWDYVSNYVTPIDNFIGCDIEGFINGSTEINGRRVSYLELVFSMAQKIFQHDSSDEMELTAACQLLYSLLHNCFEKIDPVIAPIVSLMVSKLDDALRDAESGSESLLKSLLGVLASAIHYNPKVALDAMNSVGKTEILFKIWMSKASIFQAAFEMKLFILGATSLINLPTSELPQIIKVNIKPVIMQITQMIVAMVNLERNEGENEEEEEEDEEDDPLIDAGGYGSDEDADNRRDNEYAQILQELQADSHFLYDLDDMDEDYHSALDNVDAVVYFVSSFTAALERDPEFYGRVQQELGENFSLACRGFAVEAETRRQKLLEANATQ